MTQRASVLNGSLPDAWRFGSAAFTLLLLSAAGGAGAQAAPASAPGAQPSAPPAAAPPALTGDPCRRHPAIPGREKEEAQRALGQGNAALGNGDYLKALTCFEEAFRHYSSPKLHFNIAQALHELGRLVGAIEHYEKFLRAFKREAHPQNWDIASKRIFVLQGRIATLQLQINVPHAQVDIDGASVGRSPFLKPFRLMPGPHVIVVSRPGFEKEVIQRKLEAGDNVTQRVGLLTEAAAVARRARFRRLAEERRRIQARLQLEQAAARQRAANRRRQLRTSGWALIGTGAALLAMSAVTGVFYLVDDQTIREAQGDVYFSDYRRPYERAYVTSALFYSGLVSGALVAAGGGVLLWLSRRRGERLEPAKPGPASSGPLRVQVQPTAGPGDLGLGLSVRF